MSEKVYSSLISTDGFGAQYQRVIQTYIFCKIHNLNFVYNQFNLVEHIPNNNYIHTLEQFINLKNNITNANIMDQLLCRFLKKTLIIVAKANICNLLKNVFGKIKIKIFSTMVE
jgi:hypothetical protein